MTFPAQLDVVERHVDDARAAGARAADRRPRAATGPGRFYEPTVLVDVDHSMAAMTEETFGPTLPIMRVADAEEAIRLANDSDYGLAALGLDARRGARRAGRAARRERARCASTTRQVNYFALELPMGGWKDSGLGVPPRRRRASASTAASSRCWSRASAPARPAPVPLPRPHGPGCSGGAQAALRARRPRLSRGALSRRASSPTPPRPARGRPPRAGRRTGRRSCRASRALVGALEEDRRLPQRQRRVEAQVGHRPPGALLVAGDEPSGVGKPGRRVTAPRPNIIVSAASSPACAHVAHQVADVGQRVADRGQLPVEDRDEPGGRAGREHRVAQPVVAVRRSSPAPDSGRCSASQAVTRSSASIGRVALCSQSPPKRRSWRSR